MLPTAIRLARVPSIQFLGREGWAARRAAPIAAAVSNNTTSTSNTTATTTATSPPPSSPAAVTPTIPTNVIPETVTTVDPSLYTDEPASSMRKVIARRLTESKSTVPHFYTSIEIPLDNILNMRKVLKKDFDTKVSVNDFIIKASAMALRDVPELNSTFEMFFNLFLGAFWSTLG